MTVTLTIESVGAQGDGIATHEGEPVYVPFTAPGDVVDVRLDGKGKAHIVRLLEPGHNRGDAICPHFGTCGGCALQHLTAGYYAEWTRTRVEIALSHQGFSGIAIADPIISPVASRRRVSLKAVATATGIILGFNERGSHQVIDLEACPVMAPALFDLLKPLKSVLQKLFRDRGRAVIAMTCTESGVDLAIESSLAPDLEAREFLVDFANARDLASLTWKDDGFIDPIVIRREPVMRFADVPVVLPAGGFIQATAVGEKALTDGVLDALKGAESVVDLFSGIGTFSLPLARHAKVHAVEGARANVQALTTAANRAAHIKTVTVEHRDLFRRPLLASELARFDGLVFDPPRAGANAAATEIARSTIPVVVGVSCNPNTFGRDARILVDGGYRLEGVTPVDQFLFSPHVEVVAVFRKSRA